MKQVESWRPTGPLLGTFALTCGLFLSPLSWAAGAQVDGANGGGGGGVLRGHKPSVAEVIDYVRGYSAAHVLGSLYSSGQGFSDDALGYRLRFAAEKIAGGVHVEMRTTGPCQDEFGSDKIASIFSPIADICFNPQMFIDQTEVTINRHTFDLHADALMLHEVLHLAQKAEHGRITQKDEDESVAFQSEFIDRAETGLRPSDADLSTVHQAAYAVLQMPLAEQKGNSWFPIALKVAGKDAKEKHDLCAVAFNYVQFVEPLVLYSTGVVVNYVHLVGMESDYWLRDAHDWRAAFKTAAELDPVTTRPRGKLYTIPPSFIQIAQRMKRYHCEGSHDFDDYRQETYASKAEMYGAYRDLMVSQVSLIARKTLDVLESRFIVEPSR